MLRRFFLALLLAFLPLPADAQNFSQSPSGGGPTGIGGGTTNQPGADNIVNVINYGAKSNTKIAFDGSIGAAQYKFNLAAQGYPALVILDFRGVNTTTPVDVHAPNTGSSATPTAPSVTTTAANDYWITAFGHQAAGPLTGPAGITLPANGYQPFVSSTNMGDWMGYKALGAAGATGTAVASITSQVWAAISIAIQPANGQTISFVGASSTGNFGSSVQLWNPTGTQAGDVQIVCSSIFNTTISSTTGTFTLIDSAINAGNVRLDCYSHVVAAADLGDMTLASAGSTFTAADAMNKIACVNQLSPTQNYSTYNAELCGKVASFKDANDLILNFANQRTSAVSSTEFRYGTDDCSGSNPLQTALNALASTGGEVWIPGLSACSAALTAPSNVSITVACPASASPQWEFTTLNPPLTNLQVPAGIAFLSTNIGGAGFTIGAGQTTVIENKQNPLQFRLVGCAMLAGAGTLGFDGGGSHGVVSLGMGHALLDGVTIAGWKGDGFNGGNYSQNTKIINSYIHLNGANGVNSTGNAVYLDNDEIEGNWLNGVTSFCTPTSNGTVIVGSVIQANNFSNSTALGEVNFTTSTCSGDVIIDSYLQNSGPNANAVAQASGVGPALISDVLTAPLYMGTNSSNLVRHALFENLTMTVSSAGGFRAGNKNLAGATFINTADDAGSGPVGMANTVFSAAGTAIPSCTAELTRAAECVSDATACTSGQTYASGGSVNCQVRCNGTNWLEQGAGC